MGKTVFTAFVTAAVLVVVTSTGCGKKEAAADAAAPADAAATPDATATAAPAPPQPAAGGETLPGANSVRDALAKKDYETAVGALLALRGMATGDRQQEYVNLYGEVIDTLRAESTTDRKAAQALASLNAAGRAR